MAVALKLSGADVAIIRQSIHLGFPLVTDKEIDVAIQAVEMVWQERHPL